MLMMPYSNDDRGANETTDKKTTVAAMMTTMMRKTRSSFPEKPWARRCRQNKEQSRIS